ncbi:uncharacterized protein MICPUCDRAFT_58012 [Micromonas pusilla CCMP1545]|uniref:Predicted protein n=1 Tax=Micromonas pusilla (strain CCMP1545) TaxID=564608 RepID=C1MTB8_MICPC|nr:uncharacterized protein MICPUCDRAFT_58012 [Micromonas pusilla CCMP1545]EEH56915.1 predicted protein [Micromonas pusilla CCMP1545]|eukprot:XP_003058460.1 predicted protein [Micromonas pusilla CCMP1545]
MSTAALASTSARTRARRPSRAAAVGRRARRRGVVRAIATAADDAEEEDAVNSSAAAPAEKEEAVVAWVVRAATRDDLDALVATAALSGVSWTASQIEDELENAVARVLVASAPEEDDDLADDADVPRASSSSSSSSSSSFAGLAVAWSVAGETQILEVATAPSRRRRGVATALVRAALDLNPTGEAFLEVRASNDAALALYAALGFARVGARRAYYANPVEDAVLMRRAPPVVSARELTRLMAGLSPAEARKPPPTARGEEEARDPWTPHPQDLPRDRPAFVRRDSGAEGGGGGGFKFRSRISKR